MPANWSECLGVLRIPRLTVRVAGAKPSDVSLKIDDVEVPSTLVGAAHLADPGQRTIVGRVGNALLSSLGSIASCVRGRTDPVPTARSSIIWTTTKGIQIMARTQGSVISHVLNCALNVESRSEAILTFVQTWVGVRNSLAI